MTDLADLRAENALLRAERDNYRAISESRVVSFRDANTIRAEAAEASLALAVKALERVKRSVSYPVSTEINPRGWAWYVAPDAPEFIIETIDAALSSTKPLPSKEPSDA